MGAIFGYSWFDLLHMILIVIISRHSCQEMMNRSINHSDVANYPTGFT
jgi:hypothetical protein